MLYYDFPVKELKDLGYSFSIKRQGKVYTKKTGKYTIKAWVKYSKLEIDIFKDDTARIIKFFNDNEYNLPDTGMFVYNKYLNEAPFLVESYDNYKSYEYVGHTFNKAELKQVIYEITKIVNIKGLPYIK